MNKTLKSTIIGVGVVIAMLAFAVTIDPRESRAAGVGGEEYKVVSITDYMNDLGQLNDARLEAALNKFGQQGWKVRVFVPGYFILAK